MTTYTTTEDHVTIPLTLAFPWYTDQQDIWPISQADAETVGAAILERAQALGVWSADAGVDIAAVTPDVDRLTLPFGLCLQWFMASDPSPLSEDDDTEILLALDARARELGFDSWVEAFHEWEPARPALSLVR